MTRGEFNYGDDDMHVFILASLIMVMMICMFSFFFMKRIHTCRRIMESHVSMEMNADFYSIS